MIAGIVGGIAPESTIEYYRSIIRLYRQRTGTPSYPRIAIHSIDLDAMLRLVAAGDRGALTSHLLEPIHALAHAGADFALFASNTPHVVFDEVERGSPIPLISIVRVACAASSARGFKRLGLLGTRYTMESSFYADTFRTSGMEIVVPPQPELSWVHDRYVSELIPGVFLESTRAGLLGVIESMRARDGIDAVILGGTELPLILTSDVPMPVPAIDTTRLHVEAAVQRMIAL